MSSENQVALATEQAFPKASTALSLQLGLEPRAMIEAIKTQFFKGKEATDAQLAVVVSTARALGLNPLLPGQLYPYPDRSGAVTIMLGPDGIYTLLANNPDIVAQKDGGPAYYVEHGKDGEKETCTGFVNHRTKGLLKKTIWVDEWVVSTNANWQTRRHHMAEIRALKQAARMVIHGIPADADERVLGEMLNVTDTVVADPVPDRPPPPPRAAKGAAKVKENAVKTVDAVVEDVVPAPATPEPAKAQVEAPVAPAAPKPAEAVNPLHAEAKKIIAEANAKVVQRTTLKDGEILTVEAQVEEFKALPITKDGKVHQSIKAILTSPEFKGEVYHLGGSGNKGWTQDGMVEVVIGGSLSPKLGRVLVWVQEISPLEALPETAAAPDEF